MIQFENSNLIKNWTCYPTNTSKYYNEESAFPSFLLQFSRFISIFFFFAYSKEGWLATQYNPLLNPPLLYHQLLGPGEVPQVTGNCKAGCIQGKAKWVIINSGWKGRIRFVVQKPGVIDWGWEIQGHVLVGVLPKKVKKYCFCCLRWVTYSSSLVQL